MALDPRTPVVVGGGQVTQKVAPEEALEPVDLMAEAARRAAADAGASGLLAAVESVRVVSQLTRRYPDAGALVAERVGASPRQSLVTTMGGNSPQSLLNATAVAVQRGELDVGLLCGAEAWRTRSALRRSGTSRADWTTQPDETPPAEVLGGDLVMNAPEETERGLFMPVQVYPLFECALRAAAGRSVDEHAEHLGRLWAGFSEVAATNPYAWLPERRTPEEVRLPSAMNRMVGFPYTKAMNSNNDVDQGAAVLVCSVEAAGRLGVPADRWVFPHAGTDAHDHIYVSNRDDLRSSPAIRLAGRRALALADAGVDDLALVDLYSCFPSAVQIAADELGLGLDRQLTVTGGMSFAGGPWNNYVMHSIATMLPMLREQPEALGLVTANGGYVTKHAFGVYGASPPPAGFRWESPQAEIDALPARAVVAEHDGPVTLEAYTVLHDRDGSRSNAFAACLTGAGARAWGVSTDPAILEAMTTDDLVGRPATRSAGGELRLHGTRARGDA
ncbi:MAG: acetyl-CoA acetyltransferase [Acidimicrobiia bacterium]|nr:acetyl-CoA acetyltransferase [Acidimicrobiia bacterium]